MWCCSMSLQQQTCLAPKFSHYKTLLAALGQNGDKTSLSGCKQSWKQKPAPLMSWPVMRLADHPLWTARSWRKCCSPPENSLPWYILKTIKELCTNIQHRRQQARNTAACRAFPWILLLHSLNLQSFLSVAWILLFQGRMRNNVLS